MDTINAQMYLDNQVIHPETDSDIVVYSDTTLQKALDNYKPPDISAFALNLLKSKSRTDFCRLLHHNISVIDSDGSSWKIVKGPEIGAIHPERSSTLHSFYGAYIYKTVTIGGRDLVISFDLCCSDPSQSIFKIFKTYNHSSAGNYYEWSYKLVTDSDCFLHWTYSCTRNGAEIGKFDVALPVIPTSFTNISIEYTQEDKTWTVSAGNSSNSISNFPFPDAIWTNTLKLSAKTTWNVYIGDTADAWFDNFYLAYDEDNDGNLVVLSDLDFK